MHTNTHTTMRALVLGLIIAPLGAVATAPLRVEVHTSPRTIIRNFVLCEGQRASLVPGVPGVEVMEGTATWTASGGVPPYVLVHFDRGQRGIVTVSVRDQEGNEAHGTGYISENHMERRLPCPQPLDAPEDPEVQYAKPRIGVEDDDDKGRKVQARDRLDVPRPSRLGSEPRTRERLDVPRDPGMRREHTAPRPPRPDPAPAGRPVHRSGSAQPVYRTP